MNGIKVSELPRLYNNDITVNDNIMIIDHETKESSKMSLGQFLGSNLFKSFNKLDKSDYTAFEVFPTSEVIPAGTISDTVTYGEYWSPTVDYKVGDYILSEDTKEIYTCKLDCPAKLQIKPGITESWNDFWDIGREHFDGYFYKYTVDVPANDSINIRFYSHSKSREDCDIVVDWGDGYISKVSDINDDSITSFTNYDDKYGSIYGYSNLYINHTYDNCVSEIEDGKLVKSNKYIIRVYGKDYFMIRCGDHDKNPIVSRIFSRDLPLASNVTNLSSFPRYSKRLLEVDIPEGYLNLNNVSNMANAFADCTNLRYFHISGRLLTHKIWDWSQLFSRCDNLECDINNFNALFMNGNTVGKWYYLFFNCSKLYGTVNPKVYWENPSLNDYYTNDRLRVDGCFSGCNSELRAQVPTSWGGTNKDLDNKLELQKLGIDTADYTAFEVFPTTEEIPAGTVDEVTGITYYNKVRPWNLFGLELKTKHLQVDSNIIIDWGDGKIIDIKNTTSDIESPTSTIDRDSMYYPSSLDDSGEIKIEFTHKYETQGRYIVKIYGNTYWSIRAKYSSGFSNLISRIFETDLPISSCITNVSSLCRNSLRIQKVKLDNYTLFPNIINITYLFGDCKNLDYVKGFTRDYGVGNTGRYNAFTSVMYGCSSVFSNCQNLSFSDYILPNIISSNKTAILDTYRLCSKLDVDVLTLLPESGFSSKFIKVKDLFSGCAKLICSDYNKLADILWNDNSISWSDTALCFKNCTSLDLSKIPSSWGGTNTEFDKELLLKKLGVNTSDYTAFEVFPTNKVIPAGTIDSQDGVGNLLGISDHKGSGLIYSIDIPAQMECYLDIRVHTGSVNPVIIDWGDSIIDNLSEVIPTKVDGPETKYIITHTYSLPGKYVVNVYGDYYQLRNTNITQPNTVNPDLKYKPLISRLFDSDLPISSKLLNVSSLCYGDMRLLKLNIPEYYKTNLININSLFFYCRNLLEVNVPDQCKFNTNTYTASASVFRRCINLKTSNFKLPSNVLSHTSTDDTNSHFYRDCSNLESPIQDLIPNNGFNYPYTNLSGTFYGCSKLTGDVTATKTTKGVNRGSVADILWNSKVTTFGNTLECFSNCSDEIRSQVPISWGGSKVG